MRGSEHAERDGACSENSAHEQPCRDREILHMTPAGDADCVENNSRATADQASVSRLLRPAGRASGSSWYSRIFR